ncbi:MAG: S41 family peptidase [Fimbriimonadales bacterium]
MQKRWLWSLSLLGLAFAGGWVTRYYVNTPTFGKSTVVVQRDFAPAVADSRVPKSNPTVSEPAMVRLYWRVWSLVQNEYVEPVDADKLLQGSLSAMLASLNDPRSQYLEPKQYDQYARALNGEVDGIGAVLKVIQRKTTLRIKGSEETAPLEQNLIQVVSVVPGSPAEKAGLQPGDLITYIDKQWIISEDPFAEVLQLQRIHSDRQQLREASERARERLRNSITISQAIETLSHAPQPNERLKPLQLTVQRGGNSLDLTVTRSQTRVRPVEYKMLPNRVGYVRLNLLNARAASEFSNVMTTLQKGGANALVIDLRGTAIGQQEPTLQILNQLVRQRTVATVEYREGKQMRKRALNLRQEPKAPNLRIAVLVDRGTYNLAELMALALRTGAKAHLFGTTTAGDAAQTALYRLDDGSAFTLTVGRYYGTDNTAFHQRGIQPDERVAEAVRMRGQPNGDPVLDRALRWLSTAPKEKKA